LLNQESLLELAKEMLGRCQDFHWKKD